LRRYGAYFRIIDRYDLKFFMRYQYKRESLTADEANRQANAYNTHKEKLIIFTLLDTGIRVGESTGLTKIIKRRGLNLKKDT
jgi:hypothetical protein